jgi:ornithine--oxo-acid transaminase
VVIPPAGYLKRARELCTANNVVLILDDIQTGLERAGRLLAEEHEEIEADVTLVGKGAVRRLLSGVRRAFQFGGVGRPQAGPARSTFGGNPLACAVARAAIRVLVEEGMIENAARQGAHLLDALRVFAATWCAKCAAAVSWWRSSSCLRPAASVVTAMR